MLTKENEEKLHSLEKQRATIARILKTGSGYEEHREMEENLNGFVFCGFDYFHIHDILMVPCTS